VLDGRPGGHPQARTHLVGDDHRQGRLAESGWPGQQDMVRRLLPGLGRIEHERELFAHLRLADEIGQAPGPQRRLVIAFGRLGLPGHESVAFGAGQPLVTEVHLIGAGFEGAGHLRAPSTLRAALSSAEVPASAPVSLTTSATASSACGSFQPSPTRASTTCWLPPPKDRVGPGAEAAGLGSLFSSSRMIREAPFLPIPGTRVSAFASWFEIAEASSSGPITDRIAIANRGPMPEIVRSTSKVWFSSSEPKP